MLFFRALLRLYPESARIYLPGSGVEDGYKALPMLVGRLEWNNGAAAEAFWKFDFAPRAVMRADAATSSSPVVTPGATRLRAASSAAAVMSPGSIIARSWAGVL